MPDACAEVERGLWTRWKFMGSSVEASVSAAILEARRLHGCHYSIGLLLIYHKRLMMDRVRLFAREISAANQGTARLRVKLNAMGCCCLLALFSLRRSRAARSRAAFVRSD